jgi:hypothetical protein
MTILSSAFTFAIPFKQIFIIQGKAVPQHTYKGAAGRGYVAPTH